MTKRIVGLSEKLSFQKKTLKAFLVFAQDVEIQLGVLVNFLCENSTISREDYDKAVDESRGLRMKDDKETIENGDVVWASYKAYIGRKTLEEQPFPIRVGAGKIAFEQALVGHFPHTNFKHTMTFPEASSSSFRGKTVEFEIYIKDVKTPLKKEGPDGIEGSTEPQNNN
jgi:FKBP-type peptidyl-prolyl cis-trans isomerase (trigger factor)